MMFYLFVKLMICFGVFLVSLGVAAYSTLWERKFAAFLQDRIGPDRAGPFGILQPIADGIKMFMKEEFIPANCNKFLFILGPSMFMLTALLTGTMVPWTHDLVTSSGKVIQFQIADLPVGVLFIFGVVSVGVYGIMIGGWASNNKYSLLGAIRASSQMISYELAMGISIIALLITAGGSMSFREIVEAQDEGLANIVYQPLGFLIFFTCALAEANRAPFDLPECESELVGGYHTEFSSMKLGLFLFAEYINMFTSSAILSTFYFGGYHFPFENEIFSALGWQEGSVGVAVVGFLVLFLKTVIFINVFMWIRWTLPRFRYDQLMNLGWKVLIPLSLFNLALTTLIEYLRGNLQF